MRIKADHLIIRFLFRPISLSLSLIELFKSGGGIVELDLKFFDFLLLHLVYF